MTRGRVSLASGRNSLPYHVPSQTLLPTDQKVGVSNTSGRASVTAGQSGCSIPPRERAGMRQRRSKGRSGSQHLAQPGEVLVEEGVLTLEELDAAIEADDEAAHTDEHEALANAAFPP